MASKAERTIVNTAGLVQGIVLVAFRTVFSAGWLAGRGGREAVAEGDSEEERNGDAHLPIAERPIT